MARHCTEHHGGDGVGVELAQDAGLGRVADVDERTNMGLENSYLFGTNLTNLDESEV